MKLLRDLPALPSPPWPGELGRRIYDQVSAEAWAMWEEQMKMILNEYRLLPFQKEAQQLVAKHMEEYFFGTGAAAPPDAPLARHGDPDVAFVPEGPYVVPVHAA